MQNKPVEKRVFVRKQATKDVVEIAKQEGYQVTIDYGTPQQETAYQPQARYSQTWQQQQRGWGSQQPRQRNAYEFTPCRQDCGVFTFLLFRFFFSAQGCLNPNCRYSHAQP